MELHSPVLADEVVEYLNVRPSGIYIDGTLNGGGHAKKVLERLTDGKVVGIERDRVLVEKMKKEHIKNLIVCEGNYKDMKTFLSKNNIQAVDGVVFDFGMSSWHLEMSGRGFSFQKDEPLDMRYSQKEEATAASLVNSLHEDELAKLFAGCGEEQLARRAAHAIVEARRKKRIITTKELVEVVASVIPKRGKIHPATKIFQALRIAVNKELENVSLGLEAAFRALLPHGRIAAISFHSLEDRIVKNVFRKMEDAGEGMVITKKPIVASRKEVLLNPRSRTARLRVWEKL